MKKIKMEKGITLIALIITIVILLILAVVSIGVIKNSSIITHSQNAKKSWQKVATQEEVELKLAELKLDMAGNSDKYEFKIFMDDGYEENDLWIVEDDGSLKKIFDSVDLTIVSSQLTSDGKLKFNQTVLELNCEEGENAEGDIEYYICNYNISCIDKNNEEKIVNVKFTMREYETEEEYGALCKIININVLGELEKVINTINEKIINNKSDYKVFYENNEVNEAMDEVIQLIYKTLVDENITIESTELLNSEKNGFDFNVLFDDNNPKVEYLSVGTTRIRLFFDCNCSKNGETLTIGCKFTVEYDEDTKDRYVYGDGFTVK